MLRFQRLFLGLGLLGGGLIGMLLGVESGAERLCCFAGGVVIMSELLLRPANEH